MRSYWNGISWDEWAVDDCAYGPILTGTRAFELTLALAIILLRFIVDSIYSALDILLYKYIIYISNSTNNF